MRKDHSYESYSTLILGVCQKLKLASVYKSDIGEWYMVTNIDFTEVHDGKADIGIERGCNTHICPWAEALDGAGNTLPHVRHSPKWRCHFDADDGSGTTSGKCIILQNLHYSM